MPKQKTKKAAKKRFKITKTGKVLRRAHGARHLRRKKSASRKRRQDRIQEVENSADVKRIKKLISS